MQRGDRIILGVLGSAVALAGAAVGVSLTTAGAADPAPAGYVALDPHRIIDTRTDGGAIAPNSHRTVVVTGGTTTVPLGASAVAVNLTAVSPSADTYLTAYPSGGAVPTASNVNALKGQTIPNFAIVRVGTGGSIDVYNFSGTTNFIIDVVGYYGGTVGATTTTVVGGSSSSSSSSTTSTTSILPISTP